MPRLPSPGRPPGAEAELLVRSVLAAARLPPPQQEQAHSGPGPGDRLPPVPSTGLRGCVLAPRLRHLSEAWPEHHARDME